MSMVAAAGNWVRRQVSSNGPKDDLAAMVLEAVEEAQSLRQEYENRWDRNAQLYGGKHWLKAAPQGAIQYTFNKIQLACDAITAVVTEQRPKTTFAPRETNVAGVFYLAQPAGQQAMANIYQLLEAGAIADVGIATILGTITPEQWSGVEPLAYKQGQFLAKLVQIADIGQTIGLAADDIVEVTDTMLAGGMEVVYEGIWDKNKWDWWFLRCRDASGIYGHQDTIYQYDEDTGKHDLILPPPKNTWIDPAATDIDDAQHYHWAQIMDKDKAIRRFPHLREAILENASATVDDSIGGGRLSDVYTNTTFHRERVVLLTSWFRDHEFEDGEYGILQVRTIAGSTVDSGRCAYRDIPAIRQFNMPIPYRPYGRGEPEILEGPQDIVNRLGSIIGNIPRFHQFPQQFMARSVRKNMKPGELHAAPGRTIPIDDAAIAAAGGIDKLIHTEYPAGAPAWLFESFDYFNKMMDDMAGRVDVLRGQAPSGVSSGVALDSLRREARGVIGLRAAWAEKALMRLADLVRGAIADLMPPDQWKQYTDKYPIEALTAVRALAKDVEMDVAIELSSGHGSIKEADQRKSLIMRQQGDLSQKTFLEKMEIADAEEEQQQILTEKMQMAQIEAAMAQQAAAAQRPQQPSTSAGGPSGQNAQRGEQT